MSTSVNSPLSDAKKKALLPVFLPLAVVPFVTISILGKQPKEFTAFVFSVYIALMAVLFAFVAKKREKRGAALFALLACVLFSALSVTYAYLAFGR